LVTFFVWAALVFILLRPGWAPLFVCRSREGGPKTVSFLSSPQTVVSFCPLTSHPGPRCFSAFLVKCVFPPLPVCTPHGTSRFWCFFDSHFSERAHPPPLTYTLSKATHFPSPRHGIFTFFLIPWLCSFFFFSFVAVLDVLVFLRLM